jgi:hypothetical protein
MNVLLARLLGSPPRFATRQSLPSLRSLPFLAALALAPLTQAEEKTPPAAPAPYQPTEADWLVHIELTAVLVPEKLALPLVDEFDDESKAEAAYTRLLAAIEKGDAELAGRQVIHTGSGVERTSETVEEMRYPVEFASGESADLQSKKDVRALPKEGPLSPFYPVTFDTRKVGLILTASTGVSPDGQRIAVAATPSHVRFLGWEEYPAGLAPQGQKLTLRQPKFFAATSTGRMIVRSGQRFVLGVHKLPDKPRTWELFLLKASTTRRPLPASLEVPQAK